MGTLPPFLRSWTLLFAALTVVLCAALALVVRQNRRLQEQLVAMAAAKARASGLEEGEMLAPFTLRDAAGAAVTVRFEGEAAGTLLLFHSASCEACEETRPRWRSAIAQAARPDVRVLCIQTDVLAEAPLVLEGLPPSLAVPLPPVGWLATLPAVPATLLLDEWGVLTRAWYGELDERAAEDLAQAMGALGTASSAPR